LTEKANLILIVLFVLGKGTTCLLRTSYLQPGFGVECWKRVGLSVFVSFPRAIRKGVRLSLLLHAEERRLLAFDSRPRVVRALLS
jgi:hypothetical protein